MSENHPCFDENAHFHVGRIHLPVAPKCNIKCRYCEANICSDLRGVPGATLKIMPPSEVLSAVKNAIKADPRNRIVAVAGPGDPLANDQTFETLALVKNHFPELKTCLCTNGLLLPEKMHQLSGLDYITVTINAATPKTAKKIYRYITLDGKKSADLGVLLRNQRLGVRLAREMGITVKINTVLIPKINEHEIEEIARWASPYAYIMNVMPLIPLGEFRRLKRPSCAQMDRARVAVRKHMRLFTCCKQCRADAIGVPGEVEYHKEKSDLKFHQIAERL
ncbi:MAG: radical SAM protein [Methanocellales archaeon]|nr:radical SAM protein [Methanocellales archaeon]MDD3291211.1 radical SAM protein [Methanocellales archaeon]MDD5235311.1 radical SAM protein [Methanocellales archaeon]MDD5484533.1 radical SAM protein [Methanocellales archaeon]